VVGKWIAAQKVQVVIDSRSAAQLPHSHLREISAAPEKYWPELASAVADRNWSQRLTSQAVKNLKDDRIPQEHKDLLLAGEADPVIINEDGKAAIPVEVMQKTYKDAKENNKVLVLRKVFEALAAARHSEPQDIASARDRAWIDELIRELPGDIHFLEEILAAARRATTKLEVVK